MKRIPPALTVATEPKIVSTSWWADPQVQTDRQTFYQQQHARQTQPWGTHGSLSLSSYGPYDLPRRKHDSST
jgi:hypothetical protein